MATVGGSYKPTDFQYLESSEGDMFVTNAPGGQVMTCQAAASLLLGDVVYISGQGGTAFNLGTNSGYPSSGALWFPTQVNKSATLANYTASSIGIVVGGQSLTSISDPVVLQGPNYITGGLVAATTNQIVYVMFDGICWANAGIALAVGVRITASAVTAGLVTTVGYVAGNGVAMTMNSCAGAGPVLVNVRLQ
jgi:hypothetical protein